MLYGTAWKEDKTAALTFEALKAGFRGIDTANQRKHYFEEGVGLGIQQFLKTSPISRQDLFLQTKFTSLEGQDKRLPYRPTDSISDQVKKSFLSSLDHLQTDYIDSYILHGPMYSQGLAIEDWEAWTTMEELFKAKHIHYLGISNVNIDQLKMLHEKAKVKPKFVQNRCFAERQWDFAIREFCRDKAIIYQGFSLLTANQPYILSPLIFSIAKKYHQTIPQIIFSFAKAVGILPLTGTTNPEHMQNDLSLEDCKLSADELSQIEQLAFG